MRRLLGLRRVVHDTIDELACLIEEKHELSVQQRLARFGNDPGPSDPGRSRAHELDEVRRELVRTLFDGVREANRGLQALCDRGIDLAKDALEIKPSRYKCRARALLRSRRRG